MDVPELVHVSSPGLRIAFISEHASPLATLGGVDSGGQKLAQRLSSLGHEVDICTRRDARDQDDIVEWGPGLSVLHVPAGPAQPLPKEEMWDCSPSSRSGS